MMIFLRFFIPYFVKTLHLTRRYNLQRQVLSHSSMLPTIDKSFCRRYFACDEELRTCRIVQIPKYRCAIFNEKK